MGVKGNVLDEGELDGDDCIEDEGGKEDMGGLALTVTVGGIEGGASRGESRDTTLLPPTVWFLN
jgi:hypothetical protein